MMTFNTSHPESCGIVEVDEVGRVNFFYEKSKLNVGNRANAAIYLIEPEVLSWIAEHEDINDFSTQVIPHFIGRIATWHNNQVHRDIGSIESLLEAQKDSIMNNLHGVFDVSDDWEQNFLSHPVHQLLKSYE
jgi:mannose-1-phosphate guanylyltransferase